MEPVANISLGQGDASDAAAAGTGPEKPRPWWSSSAYQHPVSDRDAGGEHSIIQNEINLPILRPCIDKLYSELATLRITLELDDSPQSSLGIIKAASNTAATGGREALPFLNSLFCLWAHLQKKRAAVVSFKWDVAHSIRNLGQDGLLRPLLDEFPEFRLPEQSNRLDVASFVFELCAFVHRARRVLDGLDQGASGTTPSATTTGPGPAAPASYYGFTSEEGEEMGFSEGSDSASRAPTPVQPQVHAPFPVDDAPWGKPTQLDKTAALDYNLGFGLILTRMGVILGEAIDLVDGDAASKQRAEKFLREAAALARVAKADLLKLYYSLTAIRASLIGDQELAEEAFAAATSPAGRLAEIASSADIRDALQTFPTLKKQDLETDGLGIYIDSICLWITDVRRGPGRTDEEGSRTRSATASAHGPTSSPSASHTTEELITAPPTDTTARPVTPPGQTGANWRPKQGKRERQPGSPGSPSSYAVAVAQGSPTTRPPDLKRRPIPKLASPSTSAGVQGTAIPSGPSATVRPPQPGKQQPAAGAVPARLANPQQSSSSYSKPTGLKSGQAREEKEKRGEDFRTGFGQQRGSSDPTAHPNPPKTLHLPKRL